MSRVYERGPVTANRFMGPNGETIVEINTANGSVQLPIGDVWAIATVAEGLGLPPSAATVKRCGFHHAPGAEYEVVASETDPDDGRCILPAGHESQKHLIAVHPSRIPSGGAKWPTR